MVRGCSVGNVSATFCCTSLGELSGWVPGSSLKIKKNFSYNVNITKKKSRQAKGGSVWQSEWDSLWNLTPFNVIFVLIFFFNVWKYIFFGFKSLFL